MLKFWAFNWFDLVELCYKSVLFFNHSLTCGSMSWSNVDVLRVSICILACAFIHLRNIPISLTSVPYQYSSAFCSCMGLWLFVFPRRNNMANNTDLPYGWGGQRSSVKPHIGISRGAVVYFPHVSWTPGFTKTCYEITRRSAIEHRLILFILFNYRRSPNISAYGK